MLPFRAAPRPPETQQGHVPRHSEGKEKESARSLQEGKGCRSGQAGGGKGSSIPSAFSPASKDLESTCSKGDAGDTGSIPGWGNPLEEEMATPSSILAWRIPRSEEPGGL